MLGNILWQFPVSFQESSPDSVTSVDLLSLTSQMSPTCKSWYSYKVDKIWLCLLQAIFQLDKTVDQIFPDTKNLTNWTCELQLAGAQTHLPAADYLEGQKHRYLQVFVYECQ